VLRHLTLLIVFMVLFVPVTRTKLAFIGIYAGIVHFWSGRLQQVRLAFREHGSVQQVMTNMNN
jgi:hypothetical protein